MLALLSGCHCAHSEAVEIRETNIADIIKKEMMEMWKLDAFNGNKILAMESLTHWSAIFWRIHDRELRQQELTLD